MLGKLEVTLENKDNDRLSYSISTLFHGAMMEMIDTQYGETLHRDGLKPYSQHIEIENNIVKWVINTLSQEARNKIINPLLDNLQSINLKHKDLILKVIEKNVRIKTYDQLLNEKYFSDGNRYINVQFTTPTAFKSQDMYVFFPELRLIYQSLMNKYDNSSMDTSIYSKEVLEHLVNNSNITKYQLKSTVFHLEGVKIPSFIGQITIKINGPQAMVNLANLLFAYGEYSGIGIKSAIGMGSIRILEKGGRPN
ncbi:MAG: CRISPR-associated endoribonuclease Cas6 [Tepidanaerobacteraceae bacterium]|nr:CRISPR-associated endoribonuclease Cas6 [Tepidanaerobacteraceae bacterium]